MTSATNSVLKYRWLFILISSLLLIYTLIGFFLLPWLAERQLSQTLQQRLAVDASVDKIQFNPFTFAGIVTDLQLRTEQDENLLLLDQLFFNFQPSQLFQLKIVFDEINLAIPKLSFTRYSEDENTLSRLTARWQETASNDAQADQTTAEGDSDEGFAFEIHQLNYLEGQLVLRDQVPETDFETTLNPINFQINDFSSQPQHSAQKKLFIALEKQAKLTVDGRFSVAPLQMQGQLKLENFSVELPERYLQAQLPFVIERGRVNLEFDYQANWADEDFRFDISQFNLQLDEVIALQQDKQTPFLRSGSVSVTEGRYDYPKNALSMDNFTVDGLELNVLQNKKGQLNLQQMLTQLTDQADPSAESETQFGVQIAEIELRNTTVKFTDQMPETTAEFELELETNVQNFSLEADETLPFNSEISLSSGGTLSAQGDVQLFPDFNLNAELKLNSVALASVQPYISQYALVEITAGEISSNGAIQSSSKDAFSFQGDISLGDLTLQDQLREEKLLGLAALNIDHIELSLAEKRIAISEANLDKLYTRVVINEDGETNLGLLMKQLDESENVEEDQQKFAFTLGNLQISEARSEFTDRNLPIVFRADMRSLNGEIRSFNTTSDSLMKLQLEGQVDEYGMVEIEGQLNPANIFEKGQIKLAFSNLDLPAMSPYTVKFAGRGIEEGKGDLDLTYAVQDGTLEASNKIVLRNIRLGERIASPQALDLPLDLAVALLENSKGIIDLEIPVSGDVNDPQFDMGAVIADAIQQVLKNIASAPFRFLGDLISGEGQDQDIEAIRFRAGRSDLAPPEQEKLVTLGEALVQRSQLILEIPAPYAEELDKTAMQIRIVEDRIEKRMNGDEVQQPHDELETVLESLYTEADLSPQLSLIRAEFFEQSETNESMHDTEIADIAAYHQALRARLISAETISESQLQALAEARQNAVIEFLQRKEGLEAAQLKPHNRIQAEYEAGWVEMQFALSFNQTSE